MHKWTIRAARVALVAAAISAAGTGIANADNTSGDHSILGGWQTHIPIIAPIGLFGNNINLLSTVMPASGFRYGQIPMMEDDGPQVDICGNAISSQNGIGTAACKGQASYGPPAAAYGGYPAPAPAMAEMPESQSIGAPNTFIGAPGNPVAAPAAAPAFAPAAPPEAPAAAPIEPGHSACGCSGLAPAAPPEAPAAAPIAAPIAAPAEAPAQPPAEPPAAAPAEPPAAAPAEPPAAAPAEPPAAAPAQPPVAAPAAPPEAPAAAPIEPGRTACGCSGLAPAAPQEAPAAAPIAAPIAAPAEPPAAAPAQPPVAAPMAPPVEMSTSGENGVLSGNQVKAPVRAPIRICGNAGALGGQATATCEGTASNGRSGGHAYRSFGPAGLLG